MPRTEQCSIDARRPAACAPAPRPRDLRGRDRLVDGAVDLCELPPNHTPLHVALPTPCSSMRISPRSNAVDGSAAPTRPRIVAHVAEGEIGDQRHARRAQDLDHRQDGVSGKRSSRRSRTSPTPIPPRPPSFPAAAQLLEHAVDPVGALAHLLEQQDAPRVSISQGVPRLARPEHPPTRRPSAPAARRGRPRAPGAAAPRSPVSWATSSCMPDPRRAAVEHGPWKPIEARAAALPEQQGRDVAVADQRLAGRAHRLGIEGSRMRGAAVAAPGTHDGVDLGIVVQLHELVEARRASSPAR